MGMSVAAVGHGCLMRQPERGFPLSKSKPTPQLRVKLALAGSPKGEHYLSLFQGMPIGSRGRRGMVSPRDRPAGHLRQEGVAVSLTYGPRGSRWGSTSQHAEYSYLRVLVGSSGALTLMSLSYLGEKDAFAPGRTWSSALS